MNRVEPEEARAVFSARDASLRALPEGLRRAWGAFASRFVWSPDAAADYLERVLGDHPAPRFAVRLWNGRKLTWGNPTCTVTLGNARAFHACATRDLSRLAEAYAAGDITVEGDMDAAIDFAFVLVLGEPASVPSPPPVGPKPLRVSKSGMRTEIDDVRSHYERPEELFRAFLDERMVYSCAYFAHPGQPLEDAQERKLDLVCRKLQLRPGDRLLDLGCGWGALVLWAAERYGVSALGITLSQSQAAEARRRVQRAGLRDRVTIAVQHWAELDANGEFDKVSSIGMYEHVGDSRLTEYVNAATRSLRPGGLFLNHGITAPSGRTHAPLGADFLFRYIFPGAALHSLPAVCAAMERAGLEILDVQSLRPHHALTLREWHRRYRARPAEATRRVTEFTQRAWDLYLAGYAQAFDRGLVSIHQVLAGKLDRAGRTDGPLTREEGLRSSAMHSERQAAEPAAE